MKRSFWLYAVVVALLTSCGGYDSQVALDKAFKEADEIVVSIYFEGEEVSGVKFTYPKEEKQSLQSGLLPKSNNPQGCNVSDGRMVFYNDQKEILEMQFLTSDECNAAWITKGMEDHHFPLDTALSTLLKSRLDLVRTLKGASKTSP